MSKLCFSYPSGVPTGFPDRSAAQAAPRDLRRMPYPGYSYPLTCFGYAEDKPQGGGDPSAGQPSSPGLRRTPVSPRSRY
jgi:hypothetical protein